MMTREGWQALASGEATTNEPVVFGDELVDPQDCWLVIELEDLTEAGQEKLFAEVDRLDAEVRKLALKALSSLLAH